MKKLLFGIALAAAVLAAGTAQASLVIDFGDGGLIGGTITYSGTNVSGANVAIGALKVSGDPAINGGALTAYAVQNGVLTFNTATGTISVVGAVSSLGISSPITLLSGTISSWNTSLVGTQGLVSASGTDTKGRGLLDALSIPVTTQWAFFGFSLVDTYNPDTHTGAAVSTDIKNTAVPEPGSMLLLGTGLFGLAGAVRRRMKK